jgi:2-polyprenyl-6-methoxyphenol hydroxylase-like FAD-dependent oxidoreductase
MAILDALELAEQLAANDFSDIKTAISKYEGKMRQRASEITEVTLQSILSIVLAVIPVMYSLSLNRYLQTLLKAYITGRVIPL